MIGRLQGTVAGKSPPQVLIDVNGVGYEVDVPMSTYYGVPAIGERVLLLTHLLVREDAQVLYGFLTAPERQSFRELIRISGVGPRTALAILSGLSVDDLAFAVQQQDAARLQKVPGIGKKTAERLLLELKGRPGLEPGAAAAGAAAGSATDIEQALRALGYSEREATAAIKALPATVGVSEGIRLALKALNR
jgi:Holliday junction DNA helicase RuvA